MFLTSNKLPTQDEFDLHDIIVIDFSLSRPIDNS